MNVHKNARLTPRGRERIVLQVESGQTREAVAQAVGVCPRTVRKWVDRYRREGLARLHDRSSRPHRLRQPTPQAVVEEIEQLRRQRWTGKQIAAETGVSPATVSRVLRRLGLNKLSALEPAAPVRRYEREKPGELIHLDIKKLGRIGSVGHRITGRYPGAINRHHGIGWEFVHVCIDDASRIAFVQVLSDQRDESAVAFLEAAVAHFAKLDVRIERVMTDNGSCYQSKSFRAACKRLGLRHISPSLTLRRPMERPKLYSKQHCVNGPTLAPTTTQISDRFELLHWLHRYNWHRPHGSLKANTPMSRLGLSEDNLLRLYS
jgi:transposase